MSETKKELLSVFVVTQNIDYVQIVCVKRTYSAAVRAVLDHLKENLYPFGDQKTQETEQKKYTEWMEALTIGERLAIGTMGTPYSPLISMFCSLLDAYKLSIDEAVVDDD